MEARRFCGRYTLCQQDISMVGTHSGSKVFPWWIHTASAKGFHGRYTQWQQAVSVVGTHCKQGVCMVGLQCDSNVFCVRYTTWQQGIFVVGTHWDSWLVSRCFEPNQPQRIISGLKTNFSLSPRYSFHKSFHHGSPFLKPQLRLYPQLRKANPEKTITHFIGAYVYAAGTEHGNLHPAG